MLAEKSSIIINCRRVELQEEVVGDISYAYFPLEISKSEMVSREYNGIPMYLVGDAAAGIPFQKGLTTGMKCARALVQFGGAAYPDHFDYITSDIEETSTYRAQLLSLYLQWTSYWRGDLLEWQRWSRDYEWLLCHPSSQDVYDTELLTHPVTLNRKLVLEELEDFLLDVIE